MKTTTNTMSCATVLALLSIIAKVEAGTRSGPGAEQDGALAVSALEARGYSVAGLFLAERNGTLGQFFS
jgi:hypothetical protein